MARPPFTASIAELKNEGEVTPEIVVATLETLSEAIGELAVEAIPTSEIEEE